MKQLYDSALTLASTQSERLPQQRENPVLPETAYGIKSEFAAFKAMVVSASRAVEDFRERLIENASIDEAEDVMNKIAPLHALVKQYRGDYEDVLSVTSTWAPGHGSRAGSVTGSRRSECSGRSTRSATERREQPKLDIQVELARKKAASGVEAQVDQLELDLKRKELDALKNTELELLELDRKRKEIDAKRKADDTELELLEYRQRLERLRNQASIIGQEAAPQVLDGSVHEGELHSDQVNDTPPPRRESQIQLHSSAVNWTPQTTDTGLIVDSPLHPTISLVPPIVQTEVTTSQRTTTCSAPSQQNIAQNHNAPTGQTTAVSSSNCPVTTHSPLMNSTIIPSSLDSGSISSIYVNPNTAGNPGIVVSPNQLLPQLNNLRLPSGLPIAISSSVPEYNMIVNSPVTGITKSLPIITTQVGNLTYSVPSYGAPNTVQFGPPLSTAREIPTSHVNVSPYAAPRSTSHPTRENNSPLGDFNYEDNHSTASDERSHNSNSQVRFDLKKEFRQTLKDTKPKLFSGENPKEYNLWKKSLLDEVSDLDLTPGMWLKLLMARTKLGAAALVNETERITQDLGLQATVTRIWGMLDSRYADLAQKPSMDLLQDLRAGKRIGSWDPEGLWNFAQSCESAQILAECDASLRYMLDLKEVQLDISSRLEEDLRKLWEVRRQDYLSDNRCSTLPFSNFVDWLLRIAKIHIEKKDSNKSSGQPTTATPIRNQKSNSSPPSARPNASSGTSGSSGPYVTPHQRNNNGTRGITSHPT